MKLRTLAFITGFLFLLSIATYYNEHRRGTDLIAGTDFVKGLDVEKIAKIAIKSKTSEEVVLSKEEDKFLIENQKSYPADLSKVNDLLFKISTIQVKEKVASNVKNEELKEYSLASENYEYDIKIFDKDGKEMVALITGKNSNGDFLKKNDNNDVYRAKESLLFESNYKYYIDTKLMNIDKNEVESIELLSKENLQLTRGEKGFSLIKPEGLSYKNEKLEEYVSKIEFLTFDDYLAQNDQKAVSLSFNEEVKIALKNKLIYKINLAKNGEEFYAKVSLSSEQLPHEIQVNQTDDQEKLKDIDNVIKAKKKAERVNNEKAPWIYKISKTTYENVIKDSKYFM